jgi:hypothetical protein
MKASKSLMAITIAVNLAITPSAIATPKTSVKAAGRVTTTVINTILNGAGVPAKTVGINGDFYIDTKNLNLYGPKTNGVWKVTTSLKQADIKSVTTVVGEQGGIGATGAQGEKGDKGATGNTGANGSAGLTGAIGATGIKGNDGGVGATGFSGATGLTGLTGATGPTGATGLKGDTGLTGAAGTVGATGSPGAAGTAGAAGLKGDAGLTGAAGVQGVKGDTGTAGAAGSAGAAGISVSKFASVPNISLVTATDGNSNSGIFFTSDSDGNYTFDILVTGGVQLNVDYKLNAEIVVGSSAIISQYVVASDAITFANGSAGRQYGFHIIGAAAGVTSGTSFGVRISIQYGAGTSTVFFSGRALINKVGSIG